jgi:hypothetical protein
MLIKLILTTIPLIAIIGILFFSILGFDIPIAYYEKTETLMIRAD